MNATISADVVRSTSLSTDELISLHEHLLKFIDCIEQDFPCSWGRVTRGDMIECVVPSVKEVMRVALMLKCHVKSFRCDDEKYLVSKSESKKKFMQYGVRMAIGIGELRINDPVHDIIDGEAIYQSGRTLDGMSTRFRTNIAVVGLSRPLTPLVPALMILADELLSKATARQCKILFMRMRGMPEIGVADYLGISQAAVNTHLRRAGWYAIENAIRSFEEIVE